MTTQLWPSSSSTDESSRSPTTSGSTAFRPRARLGIEIPHYCWHPGLSVVASCRMCLVETGTRDAETGEITMLPKLVPACQTPATDGTVFVTNSEKVQRRPGHGRRGPAAAAPDRLPDLRQGGRVPAAGLPFPARPGRSGGPTSSPFTSRRRAVGRDGHAVRRSLRDVQPLRPVLAARSAGTSELMVINRGSHEEIDVFPGFPLDNKLSGNVVDLCPVGALGRQGLPLQQRVWFMKKPRRTSVPGCSTGCSIRVEENQDRIYRLQAAGESRTSTSGGCATTAATVSNTCTASGGCRASPAGETDSSDGVVADSLARVARRAAIAGLRPSGRGAFAAPDGRRGLPAGDVSAARIDPKRSLVLGPVPTVGEDESFPAASRSARRNAPTAAASTSVARFHASGASPWDDFLADARSWQVRSGVWVTGGYKADWIDEETAAAVRRRLRLLVVQDLFPRRSGRADYQLPGAAFAEREGSYVNRATGCRSFRWADPAAGGRAGRRTPRIGGIVGRARACTTARAVLARGRPRNPLFFAAAGDEYPAGALT